ncbi:Protein DETOXIFICATION 35 [Ancistrocladus abbreviatus]
MESTAPLLTVAERRTAGEDYPPVKTVAEAKAVIKTETAKLWAIAGPIIFTQICQYAVISLTEIFVAHIGVLELSAVTIAISVFAMISYGFLLGMGSALETLCGQAFGAGELHMLGIYMQRSWIILGISCIILLPIYIFATPILKLLGQQEDIANVAGHFALLIIPQYFSLAINFPTQKLLQAQSKVAVLSWIAFFALILHILMLWLFIFVFGWGLPGAAAAFDITYWVISIAQLVYVVGWCKDSWKGLSLLAFKDMWAFVKLSLASAVMLCLETWYVMVSMVLTGHLKNATIAVGSLAICLNLSGYEMVLFLGVNAAVSVRVSNELGLGHPRATKYSVYVTVFQSILIGILCMAVVLLARDHYAVIFTNNKELQQAAAKLAWLLALTMVLNSVQLVISGVAIGGGWQALVGYINLACYYVFGIPLGILLGYKAHLGVEGLWGGMIAGTALQALLLLIVIYKTNWGKEVDQTSERMRKWGCLGVKPDTVEDGAI